MGDRIVRLLAVARGLEDDGQYNAASLFRAAALSETARATVEHPSPGPALLEAMDAAIAEQRQAGADADVLRRLETARTTVGAGAEVSYAERPGLYVCRFCGAVAFEAAPAPCPGCGAGALTLDQVWPIFFLLPIEREEVLLGLQQGGDIVTRLLGEVGDEQAQRGDWPLADVLAHLAGAERMMVGRARRMLAEEEPQLASVAPANVQALAGSPSAAFADLLRSYRATRAETLGWLLSLTPVQWQRGGQHREWGRLTILSQMGYLARHEQSHLGDLRARGGG